MGFPCFSHGNFFIPGFERFQIHWNGSIPRCHGGKEVEDHPLAKVLQTYLADAGIRNCHGHMVHGAWLQFSSIPSISSAYIKSRASHCFPNEFGQGIR